MDIENLKLSGAKIVGSNPSKTGYAVSSMGDVFDLQYVLDNDDKANEVMENDSKVAVIAVVDGLVLLANKDRN